MKGEKHINSAKQELLQYDIYSIDCKIIYREFHTHTPKSANSIMWFSEWNLQMVESEHIYSLSEGWTLLSIYLVWFAQVYQTDEYLT